ncbi:MAG: hypothetical protein H8D45_01270, partial [Bacteroidetes bacterium]|nr:hypothetical protein [Bacteroidota bacterium]
MKTRIITFSLILCLNSIVVYGQDTLPDNYLSIILEILDDKLQGDCEYLEGFIFSMDLPEVFLKNEFDRNELLTIISNQEISGILTYPNGKTTSILYEVVNHRGFEDIYMKTSLGYFLWEMLDIKDTEVFFAINWWYCPPARKVDLEALEITEKLLADSINWHKMDDRKCEDDIDSNKWSLFCAIKYASIQKMSEYNHHNTAIQTLRFVIDDFIPNHGFEHTLMDYNNMPLITHQDILMVIEEAKKRIEK